MQNFKFSSLILVFTITCLFSNINSQDLAKSNQQYPESSEELAWILKNCSNCSSEQIDELITRYIKSNPKLKSMCKVFKSQNKVQKEHFIKAIKAKKPTYEQVADLIATSDVAKKHKDILLDGFSTNK